jgi:hypothetical protein
MLEAVGAKNARIYGFVLSGPIVFVLISPLLLMYRYTAKSRPSTTKSPRVQHRGQAGIRVGGPLARGTWVRSMHVQGSLPRELPQ